MINSTGYYNDFWNSMRGMDIATDRLEAGRVINTRSYHLPADSDKKYMSALQKESAVRQLATVVSATRSDSRIWTFDSEGQADWGAENITSYFDNADDFERFDIQAYRLSELIRLSNEFTSDHAFAIEDYLVSKFAKSFGKSEEEAFVAGTGEGQPTGILHETKGAEIGIVTESSSAVSYDEIIRLYFSLDKKYRRDAVWIMNDETALALRTLKDADGNYLWKDRDDTIFSKPVYIVDSMPSLGGGQKPIAFGDFSYYWLVQRFPVTVRILKEKFALRGQIGYLGYEFLDGKLIRPEAVKVLQMAK